MMSPINQFPVEAGVTAAWLAVVLLIETDYVAYGRTRAIRAPWRTGSRWSWSSTACSISAETRFGCGPFGHGGIGVRCYPDHSRRTASHGTDLI
jgi:hypothetical protein